MKTGITVMRAIRNALRPLLVGVRVESHRISLEDPSDKVILYEITGTEESRTLDRGRDERYRIRGAVHSFAPGAGEDDAEDLQDRVRDIYTVVRNYVTTNKPAGVRELRISRYEFKDGAQDNARWAAITFDIDVWAEAS